jgi:hypothetical protein
MGSDLRRPSLTEDDIRRLIRAVDHDHAPEGDWRGPYGYGHRAYRPDPAARYGFMPGASRTLPPAATPHSEHVILWKRPLR